MSEIKNLKQKLEFAAKIMKCLPGEKPRGYYNRWPEIVHSPDEIAEQDANPICFSANGKEISEMEKILDWLQPLEAFETKLVWKRANHVPWKVLAYEFKSDRTTLWRKYDRALAKILSGRTSEDLL